MSVAVGLLALQTMQSSRKPSRWICSLLASPATVHSDKMFAAPLCNCIKVQHLHRQSFMHLTSSKLMMLFKRMLSTSQENPLLFCITFKMTKSGIQPLHMLFPSRWVAPLTMKSESAHITQSESLYYLLTMSTTCVQNPLASMSAWSSRSSLEESPPSMLLNNLLSLWH